MDTVYLNNAATSHPKPREVITAVQRALCEVPGDESRGSGGYDCRAACRNELAAVFGVGDPNRIVLMPSATHALNLVINGLVARGSHVVTTVLEHNSVLRPLAHQGRDLGVAVVHLKPRVDGRIDPAEVRRAIGSRTSLVVVTHASNITGSIQPVEEIAELAAASGVPLLIDAAQTAGTVRFNHCRLPGRVFVAFAGHKALLGPSGVGGLILPDDELAQLTVGGTGIRSESRFHPEELPLRHEAGTPNLPGIAGLLAGTRTVLDSGVNSEGQHRNRLVRLTREGLAALPEVCLLPLAADDGRAGVVSFTIRNWGSEMVGYVLRESFGIETRTGLQCAPMAHEFFATFPDGAVRASFGRNNNAGHARLLVDAIAKLGAA